MQKQIQKVLLVIMTASLFISMTACMAYPEGLPEMTTAPVGEQTETPQQQSTATTEAQTLSLAPDFTVFDGSGKEVTLREQTGKPVVVNLWASWCPPCKAEMPHFEQAYQENPDVVFMMVNLTSGDTREDADAFVSQSGYTFPVYYDVTASAAIAYNASAIPMTMFIDASGQLVFYRVGMLTQDELTANIARILQ